MNAYEFKFCESHFWFSSRFVAQCFTNITRGLVIGEQLQYALISFVFCTGSTLLMHMSTDIIWTWLGDLFWLCVVNCLY